MYDDEDFVFVIRSTRTTLERAACRDAFEHDTVINIMKETKVKNEED
jgi:hypothetical protein